MKSPDHKKNLILFDLDGTLIDVFDYHVASLEKVVEEVWGIPNRLPKEKRYGIPQRETLRSVCKASGVGDEQINESLELAMEKLTLEMERILPHDLRSKCLPGAKELLEKIVLRADVHLVLATGTLGPTAEILLDRSSLSRYFPVGAFGHEVDSREKLVQLAKTRGMQHFQLDSESTRVITIGDAPSDIVAGKSIGAFTVSVASSSFGTETLSEYQPDILLESLEDTEFVVKELL